MRLPPRAPLLCLLLLLPVPSLRAQRTASLARIADAEVQQFRIEALRQTLQQMPPGIDHDYFAGILANRTGHVDTSIRLLRRALPYLRASHPARAAAALEALADDSSKSFRYADAVQADDDLLAHFSAQLDHEQLQGTRDDAGVWSILRSAPPQTIAWQGAVRLPTERDAIGSLVTSLPVNGIRQQWLLDTGANLSVVSRSFARRLGLIPLPGHGQTMSGLTGIENPLQVAVLPVLALGGATLHNVVVLILDDANLRIAVAGHSYQIHAILGYPVFAALGAITFRHNGLFEAGPAALHPGPASTRMEMRLLMPVIECRVHGRLLPFSFDTGADGSFLSLRYYRQFRPTAHNWKKAENLTAGAGGMVRRRIFLDPGFSLTIGNQTIVLPNVPIFPAAVGSDKDALYGNLGQDLVRNFASFTLDFSRMTFSLGPPLISPEARGTPSAHTSGSRRERWKPGHPSTNQAADSRETASYVLARHRRSRRAQKESPA